MATVITNTDIGAFLGFSGSPLKLVAQEQLRGQNYIVVYGKENNPITNGDDLTTKYNYAKTATPYGSPLSSTNRFIVFVAPGVYVLDTSDITLDTPYIDIISLSGEADVVISSTVSNIPITVDSSDIRLRGFNLGSQAIQITDAYSTNYFENIIGGDYNFSNGTNNGISGNFKNCIGGNFSFADSNNNEVLVYSTLENCNASNYSFGYAISDCELTNCSSGSFSFATPDIGGTTISNSTLKGCVASDWSFGESILNSTLIDCSAGPYSFGKNQIVNSSKLTNCTTNGGTDSFGCEIGISDSVLTNCSSGGYSFGRTNVLSSVTSITTSQLTNCVALDNSFAVNNSGDVTFTNCTAGVESFGADQANGTYKNCKTGINSFGAGTLGWSTLIAGGQFYNCIADENSFGTNFANGTFYYCVCNGNGGWLGGNQGGMGGYAMGCKGMNTTGSGNAIYCSDAINTPNPVNFGLGSTTNNI